LKRAANVEFVLKFLDKLKSAIDSILTLFLKKIRIGTVTGGPTASVTATNAAQETILNFVLPKGDKGNSGNAGSTGVLSVVNADTNDPLTSYPYLTDAVLSLSGTTLTLTKSYVQSSGSSNCTSSGQTPGGVCGGGTLTG
jgi:hypothetical protein